MSSSARLTHKLLMNQPLTELGELFPELKASTGEAPPGASHRWSPFLYEQAQGVALNDVELIDALLNEHKVTQDPWGDPLALGERRFSFLSHMHRARPWSFALEAASKHTPDLFYSRWLAWIELAFKEEYAIAKEATSEEGVEYPHHLYQSLRTVTTRVVARTVCSAFKGKLLEQINEALEGIDSSYARVVFGGKRSRFGLFTSNDVKIAQQSVKSLETLIRPVVRSRIGGTSDGDDLISRWVNTKGQDGRSLKEDQIIDQVTNFLVMGYTSLPKLVYGAAFSITHEKQPEFIKELQRELNNTLKLITNPPIFEEGTPPPATPENNSGETALPLHHAVVLESLRLYSPHWLSQWMIKAGVFLLGSAESEESDGPTVDTSKQLWASALSMHHHPQRFQRPARFWPQRWSGNLDASLPRHAFSPFGFEGKPALSESYCVELATRILMIWFARYTVIDPPANLTWNLSLCLRPATDLSWIQRRELEQRG